MGFVVDFDPVAFRVGGFPVYWYGLAYTFGFTFLVWWLWRRRVVLGWGRNQVVDSSIIFVVLILAGGRLFEVIVYEWDWYRAHPDEIAMLWKGGMATHGLLLGSVIAAVIASRRTGTPLLRLLDTLTVAAAFIFGVGRIGNFIEGGVIGTVTSLPWGVKLPDVEGFRHPVSLYDGMKNILLIPLLLAVLRRWPAGSGVATSVFLIGYGGLRFLVDQLRDYESALFGLGPGQWFNLLMAAIGIVFLVISLRRAGKPEVYAIVPTDGNNVPILRIAILVLLVIFPLSIPNSWTTAYLHEKRAGESSTTNP
jgi:phosphatidylglycerol:prolipoprotein diacylglycerol transferase